MSDQPETVETAASASEDAQAEQMLAEALAGDRQQAPEASAGEQPVDGGEARPDTGGQQRAEPEVDLQAEVEKWRRLARKHEERAKKNAEAAARWAEFQESQLTEQERLQKRLEEAERALAEERRTRARLAAAQEHRLPMEVLELLAVDDEEGIGEAARTLHEAIEAEVSRRLPDLVEAEVARRLAEAKPAPASKPVLARSRPVESLMPGAMPSNPAPLDGNEFIRRLAGRV